MPYLVYRELREQERGEGLWDKDPPEVAGIRSDFDSALRLVQRLRGVTDKYTYYMVCKVCRAVCYENRMGGPCCERHNRAGAGRP